MDVAWVIKNYGSGLWAGSLVTLQITGVAVVCGTILGIPLGLITSRHYAEHRIARCLIFVVVECVKALPVLILLIWLKYLLPHAVGFKLSSICVAYVALSLNLAVYLGETMRGALESVPNDEIDSGYGIGMSRLLVLRRIVVPQAVRIAIPSAFVLYLNTLKLSTLASVLAVPEILHQADTIILDKFRPMDVYSTVALLFIIFVVPLSIGIRFLEKRYSPER